MRQHPKILPLPNLRQEGAFIWHPGCELRGHGATRLLPVPRHHCCRPTTAQSRQKENGEIVAMTTFYSQVPELFFYPRNKFHVHVTWCRWGQKVDFASHLAEARCVPFVVGGLLMCCSPLTARCWVRGKDWGATSLLHRSHAAPGTDESSVSSRWTKEVQQEALLLSPLGPTAALRQLLGLAGPAPG